MTDSSIVAILKAAITAQAKGNIPEAERFFKEALELSKKRRGMGDDLTILIQKRVDECRGNKEDR